MKNKNFLFIALVIIFLIALVWFVVDKQEKKVDPKTPEMEVLKQEALTRWQTNCEADGGTWIAEYEMCYNEENALTMKESCKAMDGVWTEDSMLYECEINGEMFKLGEWNMVMWETYEEMKQSCLDYSGEWLGGANEACNINGDMFYAGRWMVLDEMEESCVVEFGGEWLGGENTECLIDNITYPGNWVQIFTMKDSCEYVGGEWLAGENNECRVNGQIYSRQAWKRIDEMKDSCESVGGEYIGGDRFRCDLNDNVYFDKSWERAVKAPSMGTRCVEDGGVWNEERRSCEGLEKDWCNGILAELDLGGIGWNGDTLSCILY